jgi:AcrR family transcriptional regulator
MSDTKDKLLDAAVTCLREDGIAGLSARVIAKHAGVNQALVFYHFNSVTELVDAACRRAVDASAAHYREQFEAVTSLAELLVVGRQLHDREKALGNVAVMAQLMSGAQQDPALAETARYAMARWNAEIEAVVQRVVTRPLADIVEVTGLARAISAGFIGLELYEGVDPAGASHALDALEQLGRLVEVVDNLGPVARRGFTARARR